MTTNWEDHIESTPTVLRGKPRIRGTRIPVSLILGYLAEGAPTEVVHVAEEELCPDLALLGGLAKPLRGLGLVLRYALAFAVHDAEEELRLGMALRGRWL